MRKEFPNTFKNENLPHVYLELSTICTERGDHEKAREYLENAYVGSVKIYGKDDEITLFIKEYLDQEERNI